MSTDTIDDEISSIISVFAAVLSVVFMTIVIAGVLFSTLEIDLFGAFSNELSTLFIGMIGLFSIFVIVSTFLNYQTRSEDLYDTEEGMLNLDSLQDSPELLFEEEVWESLPDKPKNYIREATVSLSNGAYSAGTLVAIKAAEYAILEWLRSRTGRQIDHANWRYINFIVEKTPVGSNEEEKIIESIKELRDRRNSAAHATTPISRREAEQTLVKIKDLIETIYLSIDTYQARLSDFSEESEQ